MYIENIEKFDAKAVEQAIQNKEIIEFKEKTIVLASASKTRQDILKRENIEFVTIKNILDEDKIKDEIIEKNTEEGAKLYVEKLAKEKALSIAPFIKNTIIIAADTIAFYQDEILEKPKNEADARRIFNKISNSTHIAITGVCIIKGENVENFSVVSPITIKEITKEKIEELVKNPNTYLYAGGYRIDENIDGLAEVADEDFYNIMGLPIREIKEILC